MIFLVAFYYVRVNSKPQPYSNNMQSKRPLNGYFRFQADVMPKYRSIRPVSDRAAQIGKAWRALSEAQKDTYRAPARADLEAWKKKNGIKVTATRKKSSTKKKKGHNKSTRKTSGHDEEDEEGEDLGVE